MLSDCNAILEQIKHRLIIAETFVPIVSCVTGDLILLHSDDIGKNRDMALADYVNYF